MEETYVTASLENQRQATVYICICVHGVISVRAECAARRTPHICQWKGVELRKDALDQVTLQDDFLLHCRQGI
ncbi:hypothetical protein Hypma_016261 [Hypsizygus marmoreus]|uniref:Uncharacterized protein n=1 Tax=Hypsizygus marmoreus TaxID=39966 RepID=A0A369J2R0_HYPMA|nr:hypothetical protein Hypma_016261 [Hypsizygus marmoreus]